MPAKFKGLLECGRVKRSLWGVEMFKKLIFVLLLFLFQQAPPAIAGLVIVPSTNVEGVIPEAKGPQVISLVVGISSYENFPSLNNTVNDAQDLSEIFRELGHDVTEVIDPTRDEFLSALAQTRLRIRPGDTIVFYYAGHGVAVQGENLLLPVDTNCDSGISCVSDTAERQAISMMEVVEALHLEGTVFVGLFDACRDNPFGNEESAGLAQYDSTNVDSVITYSTAPGSVAFDGQGRNSPFAEALIEELSSDASRSLSRILRDVRKSVVQGTNGAQVPFTVASLSKEVILGDDSDTTSTTDAAEATGIVLPPDQDAETEPKSVRFMANMAFAALGSNPDQSALINWLQEYENEPTVQPLVETAYARLTNLLQKNMVVEHTALASADSKGGQVFRTLEPPPESVLALERTRKALIIGIDDYEHLPDTASQSNLIADLKFAENDAHAISRMMASGIMGDWQTEVLTAQRADRKDVLSKLKSVLFEATERDVVLFYFSGHGSRDALERNEHFLMLRDSLPDDATTGINFRTLERWVAGSNAGHVIVVVDACRSGFVPHGAKGDNPRATVDQDLLIQLQLAKKPNRIVITSSRADQTSWEDEELGQGIFTHYFVEAIRGAAREVEGDGFIDLGEVYEYTRHMVVTHSVQTLGVGKQEPSIREIEGKAFSNFPIAYR